MNHADSAGQSWAGRAFEPNTFAADDGSTPPAFAKAIAAFRAMDATDEKRPFAHAALIDAVRASRFLIPLVAEAGDEGVNAEGLRVDKTQELAIVRVKGPDGQSVLPIFSSVAAMSAWRSDARPVPADGRRAAVSALTDDCAWVVIDPTSDTELVVRHPALRAIAAEQPWVPVHVDDAVREAVAVTITSDARIRDFALATADPGARGSGHDLIIRLDLEPGLSPDALTHLLTDFSARLSDSQLLTERVDSLLVQVVSHQN